MTDLPQPQTAFDWPIYADATFAGLSVLIPIPLLDWLFERFFRQRMPRKIAQHRHHTLDPMVINELNSNDDEAKSWLTTCLTLPLKLAYELIKRLSRKLLYFLTVKEATDKVSYYWHQAFLLDYALSIGHLDNQETARLARRTIGQVLETITTSPLLQLAEQVTSGTRHIWRALRRAKRGEEDEVIEQKKLEMSRYWPDIEEYLHTLTVQYDEAYEATKLLEDNVASS